MSGHTRRLDRLDLAPITAVEADAVVGSHEAGRALWEDLSYGDQITAIDIRSGAHSITLERALSQQAFSSLAKALPGS